MKKKPDNRLSGVGCNTDKLGLNRPAFRFAPNSPEQFIGKSPAFYSIIEMVKAVAERKCPIIIVGETGVGKEMVARQVHQLSNRAKKVFVPVDCTTLTGQLFESQLFGHTKGAFTGAVDSTLGFFRAANGGTIFLDEISEIPLDFQAKLLRVLQENRVTPLGSTESYPIDIRVLCSTNKSLKKLVQQGSFRDDLYYRLNVVTLEVPPLRQRKEDIIPLAEYFLSCQAEFYGEPQKTLTPEVKQLLLKYSWPGNVRELANAMERAYILITSALITADAMPFELIVPDFKQYPDDQLPTFDQANREIITRALRFANGRKMTAARILGIERRRLNRLIKKLDISLTKKEK